MLKEETTSIINNAKKILQEIGVVLPHTEIVETLKKAGCKEENNRIKIPNEIVEQCIGSVPENFELCGRNPGRNFTVGAGTPMLFSGNSAPFLAEPWGGRREAVFDDFIQFQKLNHATEFISLCGGTPVVPSDIINQPYGYELMAFTSLLLSDKPLLIMPRPKQTNEQIISLLKAVYGDDHNLAKTHPGVFLLDSLSPLKYAPENLETLKLLTEYGLPVILTSAPMAGASCPLPAAGGLSLALAETLAGLVVTQTLSPGNPMICGIYIIPIDMRTGRITPGSPHFSYTSRAVSEIFKALGLPYRCGAGSLTDAPNISLQSAREAAFNLKESFRNNPDYIHHSAGMLESHLSMSYEKYMLDIELIRMENYLGRGINVDDEDLSFSVIEEIAGQNSDFFSHEQTLSLCRTEPYFSPNHLLASNMTADNYGDNFLKAIHTQLTEKLENYSQPALYDSTKRKMYNLLLKIGVPDELIKKAEGE